MIAWLTERFADDEFCQRSRATQRISDATNDIIEDAHALSRLASELTESAHSPGASRT